MDHAKFFDTVDAENKKAIELTVTELNMSSRPSAAGWIPRSADATVFRNTFHSVGFEAAFTVSIVCLASSQRNLQLG